MPVGSDLNDMDVSVQAILEGLGLIPRPGDESPASSGFDPIHDVWRVPEKLESITPPQSAEEVIRRLVQEHVPRSLCPQCRISHE